MRGRPIEIIRDRLYRKFGNENYLLFKVSEEASEVSHSITKLLTKLSVPGANDDPEEQLWLNVSEEFAQLEVYMELLRPYLIEAAVQHHREEKIKKIAKKVGYEPEPGT